MRRTLVVFCMAVATASAVSAQTAPISAGESVRLRSSAVTGRFEVVSVSPIGLAVRDSLGAIRQVDWTSIDRLAVHRGTRSNGQAFLRGLGIGSLVGVGAGILIGVASGDDPPSHFIRFTAAQKAAAAGAFLGLAGGVAGGLIGLAAPGEFWEDVSFRGGDSADGRRSRHAAWPQ